MKLLGKQIKYAKNSGVLSFASRTNSSDSNAMRSSCSDEFVQFSDLLICNFHKLLSFKRWMDYREPSNPVSYLKRYGDDVTLWAQPEVALATKEKSGGVPHRWHPEGRWDYGLRQYRQHHISHFQKDLVIA